MPTMLATTITVGEHVTTKVLGVTINLDTVWATGLAMLVVFALGLAVRRQMTHGIPGRLQLAWETIVQAVATQVEGTIGPRGMSVIPLAVTLFVFILVCNFFEIFSVGGKYELIAVPTADVNLPAAMAVFVIVLVHLASMRTRGIRGYVRHYLTQPFPAVLMPFNLFINLVEEIAKPVTLALRLFGNLFSGGLMITLIAALGAWKLGSIPIGNVATLILAVVWKLFDVFFIGPIQAFIFALLAILYFDTAMSTEHGEELARRESEPVPNV